MFLGLRLQFFLFSSCWTTAEQHRKWEGVASFFGIVALGSRKPILAQDWYVCWGRYWISAKRALAKLHQYCLNFVTACLGMLLLSFCLGGSCFAKDHQSVLEGTVVNWCRFACFELHRMLFLRCCSVFVVLPTMLETVFVVLFLEHVKVLAYYTKMDIAFSAVAFSGEWFWFGLGFV